MLNRTDVPVLPGHFPARYNEFPKVWRELATEMLQVADIYLQELPQKLPASPSAHEWLEQYLDSAVGPTDFVLTGPASNLNWALQRRPQLASKVGRVFWMAGAVDVDGNIRDSDDNKAQDKKKMNKYGATSLAKKIGRYECQNNIKSYKIIGKRFRQYWRYSDVSCCFRFSICGSINT